MVSAVRSNYCISNPSSSILHRAMLGLQEPCLYPRLYVAIWVKMIVKRNKTPQRQKLCGRQTLANPVRSIRREGLCCSIEDKAILAFQGHKGLAAGRCPLGIQPGEKVLSETITVRIASRILWRTDTHSPCVVLVVCTLFDYWLFKSQHIAHHRGVQLTPYQLAASDILRTSN